MNFYKELIYWTFDTRLQDVCVGSPFTTSKATHPQKATRRVRLPDNMNNTSAKFQGTVIQEATPEICLPGLSNVRCRHNIDQSRLDRLVRGERGSGDEEFGGDSEETENQKVPSYTSSKHLPGEY
ncbi:hypothetical protein BY996DRAFT_6417649 [Phakopsora pachyrhizi]|nr:hypothetical protein BY996DRAFT_6417649 [Phakopsora pachyrhizi]